MELQFLARVSSLSFPALSIGVSPFFGWFCLLAPLPPVQILMHNLIVAASSSFTPSPLAFAFSSPPVVPNLLLGSLLVDVSSLVFLSRPFASSVADYHFRASPSAYRHLSHSRGLGLVTLDYLILL